jgi:hypothetical protein
MNQISDIRASNPASFPAALATIDILHSRVAGLEAALLRIEAFEPPADASEPHRAVAAFAKATARAALPAWVRS